MDESDGWSVFPRTIERMLLTLVAARARHVQCEEACSSQQYAYLPGSFTRLTLVRSRDDPGYVFGLKRDHRPRVSWLEEAQDAWKVLALEVESAASRRPVGAPGADAGHALRVLRAVLDADSSVAGIGGVVQEGLAIEKVRATGGE